MQLFHQWPGARKTRRRDYPYQTILNTLTFCYVLVCSSVKEEIAVVKFAAY